jgi:hypothetical protein
LILFSFERNNQNLNNVLTSSVVYVCVCIVSFLVKSPVNKRRTILVWILFFQWQPAHIWLQRNRQLTIKHHHSISLVSVKQYQSNVNIEMKMVSSLVQEISMFLVRTDSIVCASLVRHDIRSLIFRSTLSSTALH